MKKARKQNKTLKDRAYSEPSSDIDLANAS